MGWRTENTTPTFWGFCSVGNWAVAKTYLTRNRLANSILVSHYKSFTFLDVSCDLFSWCFTNSKVGSKCAVDFLWRFSYAFFSLQLSKRKLFLKSLMSGLESQKERDETGKAGTRSTRPRGSIACILQTLSRNSEIYFATQMSRGLD